MRILLIEPFGHKGGHHPIEARKLAFYLSELNHEIRLITSSGFKNVEGIDRYDCCPIININHELKESHVKLFILKIIHKNKSLTAFFNTYYALSYAYKRTRNNNHDLIFLVSGSLSSFLFFGFLPKESIMSDPTI